jgi:RNA polymerase sigma factor (sigma-70 family)
MQPSDEQLVLACQRGDEAAWEQLVARYKRLIYAVPRRAGLDEDLAAEVFQRVLITLLECIDRIEQPSRISTWLVTTARRETWRTGKRARAAAEAISLDIDEDEQSDIPDNAPPLDETLLRLEKQHIIRTAIGDAGCCSHCCSITPTRHLTQRSQPPWVSKRAASDQRAGVASASCCACSTRWGGNSRGDATCGIAA